MVVRASTHYGVGGTEVRSKVHPIVDNIIILICGPHRLSSQHYAGEQPRRIQRRCNPEGFGLEGIQRPHVV
jgi:hypothetical protein